MKSPAPSSLRLQVFVHTPVDEIISFENVNPSASFHQLKSQIEVKTGILAEIQSLYVSNIKLLDADTFWDKKVKSGAVLRVKCKERSLEQICIAASKGDIKMVFSLGVEFIQEDDKTDDVELNAWNKFVPLRAFQALFIACFQGHLKLVTELISKSAADVRMISKNGRSCLHVAASQGHIHCVSLLLSQGVDSKQSDFEGITALMMAANNGHLKCEKRIWLFNWNLDVLNELQTKDATPVLNDDEINRKDLDDIAQRYQEEFSRTRSNHSLFPPIANKKKRQQQADKERMYQTITSILPAVAKETPSDTKHVFKKNTSKLKNVNDNGGDSRNSNQHRMTMSAPQVESAEIYPTFKMPPRVNGWTGDQHEENLQTKSGKIVFYRVKGGMKSNANVKISTKLPMNDSVETTNNVHTLKKDFAESASINEESGDGISANFEHLTDDQKRIYWSKRAACVREPTVKRILPIQVLQNVDLQESGTIRRTVIKTKKQIDRESGNQVEGKSDKQPQKFNRRRLDKLNPSISEELPTEVTQEETHLNSVVFGKQEHTTELSGKSNDEKENAKKSNNLETNDNKHDWWKPECSVSYLTNELIGISNQNNKAYDDWLRKKRKKQIVESEVLSETKIAEQFEKNELNRKAYEKWLQSKTRQRSKSNTAGDEKQKKKRDRSLSEKACPFEEWLEQKRNQRNKMDDGISNTKRNEIRNENIKNGMTFQQWLDWKKSEARSRDKIKEASQVADHSSCEKKNSSFEKWLQKKEEERKTQAAIRRIQVAQQAYSLEMKRRSRWNNPHLKTFEEWALEKTYEVKRRKSKGASDNKRDRYPEDSNLIFHMWLGEKYLKEMAIEREKLSRVKESNGAVLDNSDSSDSDADNISDYNDMKSKNEHSPSWSAGKRDSPVNNRTDEAEEESSVNLNRHSEDKEDEFSEGSEVRAASDYNEQLDNDEDKVDDSSSSDGSSDTEEHDDDVISVDSDNSREDNDFSDQQFNAMDIPSEKVLAQSSNSDKEAENFGLSSDSNDESDSDTSSESNTIHNNPIEKAENVGKNDGDKNVRNDGDKNDTDENDEEKSDLSTDDSSDDSGSETEDGLDVKSNEKKGVFKNVSSSEDEEDGENDTHSDTETTAILQEERKIINDREDSGTNIAGGERDMYDDSTETSDSSVASDTESNHRNDRLPAEEMNEDVNQNNISTDEINRSDGSRTSGSDNDKEDHTSEPFQSGDLQASKSDDSASDSEDNDKKDVEGEPQQFDFQNNSDLENNDKENVKNEVYQTDHLDSKLDNSDSDSDDNDKEGVTSEPFQSGDLQGSKSDDPDSNSEDNDKENVNSEPLQSDLPAGKSDDSDSDSDDKEGVKGEPFQSDLQNSKSDDSDSDSDEDVESEPIQSDPQANKSDDSDSDSEHTTSDNETTS